MTDLDHDGTPDPSEDDLGATGGEDADGMDDSTDGRPGPVSAPGRTSSGDPTVDAVLGTLDRLDELPVEEHLQVFEDAHRALRQSLDRPAEAPGSED